MSNYVYTPANGPQSGPAGPLAILPGQLGAALLPSQMGATPYVEPFPGGRLEVGPGGQLFETLGDVDTKTMLTLGAIALGGFLLWRHEKEKRHRRRSARMRSALRRRPRGRRSSRRRAWAR